MSSLSYFLQLLFPNLLGLAIKFMVQKNRVGTAGGATVDQGTPASTCLQNQALLLGPSWQRQPAALTLFSESFPSSSEAQRWIDFKANETEGPGLSVVQGSLRLAVLCSVEKAPGSLFAFAKTNEDRGLHLLKASFFLGESGICYRNHAKRKIILCF